MQRIAGKRNILVRISDLYSRLMYGKEAEPAAVMAHRPQIMLGWGALETGLQCSRKVDDRLKALAATKVASSVGCTFCMDIGSHLSSRAGVSERQLRELNSYAESDAFSPLEKLVLAYADEMTKTPVDVPDELFARLQEHFDQAQIVELTASIAVEQFRSRFNRALRIPAQGFTEGGYCVLPIAAASSAPSH